MGWNTGNEVLDYVWPTVQDLVVDEGYREEIYLALVKALEYQDADTLGETVTCVNKTVDPALVRVLIDRQHLEPDWDDD